MLKSNLSLLDWVSASLPPVVWALFIFTLSAQSTLPSPDNWQLDFIFKKFSHMFVYFVLYLLLWRGTQIIIGAKNRKTLLIAPFIIACLYAITDETHQYFVPGRQPTIRDLGFDVLGITTAFLWWYRYI